jgi:hypothetical protein
MVLKTVVKSFYFYKKIGTISLNIKSDLQSNKLKPPSRVPKSVLPQIQYDKIMIGASVTRGDARYGCCYKPLTITDHR